MERCFADELELGQLGTASLHLNQMIADLLIGCDDSNFQELNIW
jgi:hypothetical protein